MVFFVAMGLSIIVPALPTYARDFGATNFMIGGLVAGFGVARVIFDLPAGVITQKINEKILMQFGLVIIVISSVAAAFAPSYVILLVARVFEGVGSAFYIIASSTILNAVVSERHRGKAFSYYTASLLLGPAIGPSLGGFVISLYGNSAPFLFYALFVGIGLFAATFLLKSYSPGKKKEQGGKLRHLLKDRSILLVGFASLALAFTWTGLRLTVIPIFAYDNLLLTPSGLGLALSLTAGGTLVTTIIAGQITDKVGRRIPVMLGLLSAAGMAIIIFTSTSFLTFALFMLLSGLTTGIWGQTVAWIVDLAPKGRVGAAIGINRTLGDSGFVLGPLLLGYMATLGLAGSVGPLPFYSAAILLAIAGILLLFARDPVGESRKTTYEGQPG
ncbi:MAG: MFS transporter [Nitrososphaerales archaeon]